MNILVVDDKKSVQDMLYNLLSDKGYNVDVANNGLDALGKANKGNYQLYIIDHLMPLMNGLKLSKNLKNNPETSDKNIIFITTQGEKAVQSLPEYKLFDQVLDKPINESRLLELVSEFTEYISADNLAFKNLSLNA